MIKINLNPEKRKKKEAKFPSLELAKFSVLIFTLPIIFIIGAIVYIYFLENSISNLKAEKNKLTKEKQKYIYVERKLIRIKKEYSKLQQLIKELELKRKIYEKLTISKVNFNKNFEIVGKTLPEGIWLDHIYLSTNRFNFKGYAFDPKKISLFYNNLNQYFEKVNFDSTKRESNKMNSFYSFSLKASGFKSKGENH
ncbi:PilN domain-containing protein [Hydrogenothermus marinus]|uniref:Tfp pilus assembly protein PilN n=1 Tax=Hydrogenothermus marinus TaxID=133270 RepID=A0A3M0BNV1_9AQUI|nr:PilN domain-containing protein [Hydrogenothermus marinus]RMA96105.1 Tfp pilus assembly protein PilN [Hydrogenothermus marinus]